MCGILGLVLADPLGKASLELNEALNFLQHRGQDAAGIVTCGLKGRFYQCKGNGMVRDVFSADRLANLCGPMGLGHLRYPTAGSSANSEAQPFYVNSPYGISLSHNGNIINAPELRRHLDEEAHRHINTDSDSELIINIFAEELQNAGKRRLNEDDLFKALVGIYEKCQGAFSCVALVAGYGVIGFRDAYGIRPLQLSWRKSSNDPTRNDYLLASESVVFECMVPPFADYVDLKPGEAVIIPRNTMVPVKRQIYPQQAHAPDIFEYVYFARPDSVLDGVSVYRSRLLMGKFLSEEVRRRMPDYRERIDVVVPVPDTARECALELAQALGLLYREAFIKNRYVGRTFIMPGQNERRKNVRRKLNAMASEFGGRRVLIVDDSIVRGTTSKEIVQMAREKGAVKVYVASCSPPIRYPHIFGIDLADAKELVAYGRTEAQVAAEIGADEVIYQQLPDLIRACRTINPSLAGFETGVFTGEYITGVHKDYLRHLEEVRGVNARKKKNQELLLANGMNEREDVYGEAKAEEDISLYNSRIRGC